VRSQGTGWHSRRVLLNESHPPQDDMTVSVVLTDGHARLSFDGYWHSAHVAMSHAELERVRDAINAVLAEGVPTR
jgi:DICT domain-containing protein